MGALELNHAALTKILAFKLGYGRTAYASLSSAQKGMVDQIIDQASRLFFFPDVLPGRVGRHRWSFLWPQTTLTLTEAYSTGTITVTPNAGGSIVTGVGTAWDGVADLVSDAGDWELTPAGGATYKVKQYDNATQILLNNVSVTVAAGTTYSLGRAEYSMPSDFGGLEGAMTYAPSTSMRYQPIKFTSWSNVRRSRQLYGGSTQRPQFACLIPAAHDMTAAQTWKIIFDYQADAAHTLYYRYKINVSQIDTTNIYPVCGAAHSETLLAACLYKATTALEESPQDVQNARGEYLARLAASIADDEAMTEETQGRFYDPSLDESEWRRHNDLGVVPTYNGVPIS